MNYDYTFFDLLFIVSGMVLLVITANIVWWYAIPAFGLFLSIGINQDRIRNIERELNKRQK